MVRSGLLALLASWSMASFASAQGPQEFEGTFPVVQPADPALIDPSSLERLPGLTETRVIPLPPATSGEHSVQFEAFQDRVRLVTRDAPLSQVLAMIAQQLGLNIVTGEELNQRVTVTLNQVQLDDALHAILSVHGLVWSRQKDIITVSGVNAESNLSPLVHGRLLQVFSLNYAQAGELDKVVKGLLSPIGKSYIVTIDSKDQRKAHEQLIVEDMPDYLERIARYVAQVDVSPRQVIVEANILQVTLKSSDRHGVNFDHVARLSRSTVNLKTVGLAANGDTAAAMEIAGSDLTGWIEALKSTTDTKTLASPKITVLNGQEAKISVGGKLGYLLTTATNTSTLQSVNFLEYGVVLTVVPVITEDGRVLMKVSPTVSTARINPTSKLPESEATEVQTNVVLNDGQALVIGGLIKENLSDAQNKIPWLGDLWLIGKLFQGREQARERNEIIVTLLPRIAAPGEFPCGLSSDDAVQAGTPLMDNSLHPVDRAAFEGHLPDASDRKNKPWRRWFRHEHPPRDTPHPVTSYPAYSPATVEYQVPASPSDTPGWGTLPLERPLAPAIPFQTQANLTAPAPLPTGQAN